MRRRYAIIISLAFATGAVQAQQSVLTRGADLLAPFQRDLQEALRRGLAQGPVEAMAACQLQAPDIARAHSRDGVRLGRASDRLRNPLNVPPDWVRPILDAYLANPLDRAARAVSLPGHQSGYVEPILLQPQCLTCHGDALVSDVASRLRELYPLDRATGFRVGDLRGVFWVAFPASE